jgi:hypothetical protein
MSPLYLRPDGHVYGIKEDDYVNIMWDDGLTENKHDQKYKIIEIKKDETDPKLYVMKLNGTIPDEAFYTEKHGGTIKKKNKTFWCHAKDDVSAKDLFRFQRGSDEDRGIIAKYCIMDCVLVTKLMEKTQVLNNNIGSVAEIDSDGKEVDSNGKHVDSIDEESNIKLSQLSNG